MWQKFSQEARKVIFDATKECMDRAGNHMQPEHILLGMCRDPDCTAMQILSQLGVQAKAVVDAMNDVVGKTTGVMDPRKLGLSREAKKVIDKTCEEARALRDRHIGSEHLLLALVVMAGRPQETLQSLGVTEAAVRRVIETMTVVTS